MNSNKPKVLIAIPTSDGNIAAELTANLFYWSKQFEKGTISLHIVTRVHPVDKARNQLVKFFMEDRPEPFTHLLFIDADTVPPKDAISKLLAHDKAVVTGLTPMLMYDKDQGAWSTMYNVFDFPKPEHYGNDGKLKETHCVPLTGKLEKAHKCGTSCLLIKREVFEKIGKPYFKYILNEDGTADKASEDLNFCNTIREHGFDLYCDTSIRAGHYKTIKLG